MDVTRNDAVDRQLLETNASLRERITVLESRLELDKKLADKTIAELEQEILARDITIKELGRAAKSALDTARVEERERVAVKLVENGMSIAGQYVRTLGGE